MLMAHLEVLGAAEVTQAVTLMLAERVLLIRAMPVAILMATLAAAQEQPQAVEVLVRLEETAQVAHLVPAVLEEHQA
jgi:hypothetical protein